MITERMIAPTSIPVDASIGVKVSSNIIRSYFVDVSRDPSQKRLLAWLWVNSTSVKCWLYEQSR